MSHGGGDPAKVMRVESVIDDIETRVRRELLDFKKIFVEPDSKGDLRGVAKKKKKPEPAAKVSNAFTEGDTVSSLTQQRGKRRRRAGA